MLMTTDTVLVQRAALGDREAFASIYEESFRCVYAFAVRQASSRAAAEALTEIILVRVVAALDSYAGEVPFAAWLQSIAKSVVQGTGARRGPTHVAPKSPFAHSFPRCAGSLEPVAQVGRRERVGVLVPARAVVGADPGELRLGAR